MSKSVSRGYPRTLHCGAASIELRHMCSADGAAVRAFLATLPTHDLLFVQRDVQHPKVIAAWLQAVEDGVITSLVAYQGEQLVGCTAIVTDVLSWSRHVGELRVLIAPAWRGRGLGRGLIEESFKLALKLKLEKLVVQMTVDQSAAIVVFEELGFHAEAVLRDHVKDPDGKSHDLAVLSLHVAELALQRQARGMSTALNE
ncbi:GNAT family N-acetyltransferase [Pseudomonas sp. UL073]|uniref:GNAT family N-acetyltransferase n=1 Tax=Zestomonas insulae TaxID=2809017 RepID=A0ABS2IHI8_9GAMM|nr:GNAT family N-acetyltransferase [Pseudomonas insulae]MBM7062530.1 GNAT family N-acetyltransferase [Pseudomonas insulae]